MTSCKEYYLDDAMAITAIPIANIPAISVSSPANSLTPTISKAFVIPSVLSGAITIGVQPATEGGILIPIVRFTGKAKDEESDDVAGRLHTVTVTCQADDRESDVWASLLALERTPSQLLLTFRNKAQAFVSATADTYLCTVERDGAKTSVTFRIQNYMGIQLLI